MIYSVAQFKLLTAVWGDENVLLLARFNLSLSVYKEKSHMTFNLKLLIEVGWTGLHFHSPNSLFRQMRRLLFTSWNSFKTTVMATSVRAEEM